MNFLFWNCRGAVSPSFRRCFRNFIRSSQADVAVLFETRVNGKSADLVIRKLGFDCSFRVKACGFSGGIWLLWNDNVDVEIIQVSTQFIHYRCRVTGMLDWCYVTVDYASPNAQLRNLVWDHLARLDPGDDVPWVLGGDFNTICCLQERKGGADHVVGISQRFNDFIASTGLIDMGFLGNEFTWRGGSLF